MDAAENNSVNNRTLKARITDLREKSPVEIAQETIAVHEKATDNEYAEYAYYSAVILARELLAFNKKIDDLVDALQICKEMFNDDED